jgi:hypothetical protein
MHTLGKNLRKGKALKVQEWIVDNNKKDFKKLG